MTKKKKNIGILEKSEKNETKKKTHHSHRNQQADHSEKNSQEADLYMIRSTGYTHTSIIIISLILTPNKTRVVYIH